MRDAMDTIADPRYLLEVERAARAEAERVLRMKDEFLVLVSHELRTPLSAVLGWSELLQRTGSHESLAEGLKAIEHNARAQVQIIDDLLDAGRMMSGKIRLDLRPVRLATVVDAAVNTLRPAAIARQIRLESASDSRIAPILADSNRLGQVFRNLISNAIKFTSSGGQVNVVIREVSGVAEASIVDTGQGMDSATVDRVFERFWQADGSTARRDGLGLGLWVVKQIVELHGGTVRAMSDGMGAGSRFIVRLPFLTSARLSHVRP